MSENAHSGTKDMRGNSKEFLTATLQDVKMVLHDQEELRKDNNALTLVVSRLQRDLADAEREIERVNSQRDVLRSTLFNYLEQLIATQKPDNARWAYTILSFLTGALASAIVIAIIAVIATA